MIVAQDIREMVLRLAKERAGKPFNVADVAREMNPTNWRSLIDHVGLVIDSLITEGKIAAVPGSENVRLFKSVLPNS